MRKKDFGMTCRVKLTDEYWKSKHAGGRWKPIYDYVRCNKTIATDFHSWSACSRFTYFREGVGVFPLKLLVFLPWTPDFHLGVWFIVPCLFHKPYIVHSQNNFIQKYFFQQSKCLCPLPCTLLLHYSLGTHRTLPYRVISVVSIFIYCRFL